jgi:hypothetical protein
MNASMSASLWRHLPKHSNAFRAFGIFSSHRQARWVSDDDVRKQNQFIDQLFDMAA